LAALANLTFVAQGVDLIIDKAVDSAKDVAMKMKSIVSFAAVNASKSKFSQGKTQM
jgi:hypothetical protein